MKNKGLPSLVSAAILATVAVASWVGFEIYRAVTASPTPEVPPEISAPFDPKLDEQALERIERRILIDESEIRPSGEQKPLEQEDRQEAEENEQ